MPSRIIEVNAKTMDMLKQLIPDTKNPIKAITSAMAAFQGIQIFINNDLEDGVFRFKEVKEDE